MNYFPGSCVIASGFLYQSTGTFTSFDFGTEFSAGLWESIIYIGHAIDVHIKTPEQLVWASNCPAYNYILDNNIDMIGQLWIPIGGIENGSSFPDNGINSTGPFTGNFDGQGFTISNLSYDDVALSTGISAVFHSIGAVYNNSTVCIKPTIKNVTFDNCSMTNGRTAAICVGLVNTAILQNIEIINSIMVNPVRSLSSLEYFFV
jgi:hypothetical protein